VKRYLGFGLAALMLIAVATPAATAAEEDSVLITSTPNARVNTSTKGPFYDYSEGELRMRKFARGVANVFLCVAEIPNQMFKEAYRTSPVTGVVVGAGKGVVAAGKRLAIGLWETVTFFNPGTNHYQPLIEPEVVLQEYLH
jgi:putative exosortase-associated protein (TIGR04073 family)